MTATAALGSASDPLTGAAVRSLHRVLIGFDTVDRAGLDDDPFAPAGVLTAG